MALDTCSYDDATALVFRQKARRATSEGRHSVACDYYREALKHNPFQEIVYIFIGESLMLLQDYEGAYKAAVESLRLNPHLSSTREKLKSILVALGRGGEPIPTFPPKVLISHNRHPKAEVLYAAYEARRSATKSHHILTEYGNALYEYTAAIALCPTDEYSYEQRCQICYLCQWWKELEWYASDMCRIFPGYVPGHMYKAKALGRSNKHLEAMEEYRKSAQFETVERRELMEELTKLGQFAIMRGNTKAESPAPTKDSSTVSFKAQNEDAAVYLISRAQRLNLSGAFEATVTLATAAIKHDPRALMGYICRSIAQSVLGNQAEAVADLSEWCKLDPGVPSYSELLCELMSAGRVDEAVAAVKKAKPFISNDPDFRSLCQHIECIASHLDTRTKLSRSELQAQLDTLLEAAPPLLQRSRLQSQLGNHDAAIADALAYRKACASSRDEGPARLAFAYLLGGRIPEAADYFTKARPQSQLIGAFSGLIRRISMRGSQCHKIAAASYTTIVDQFLKGDYFSIVMVDGHYDTMFPQMRFKPSIILGKSLLHLNLYNKAARIFREAKAWALDDDEKIELDQLIAETLHDEKKSATEMRQQGNKELQEGKLKESLKSYTACIHKNPNDELAYSNRSLAHSKLGNFEDAAADARECTRLNPEFAKGHCRLGSALMSLGRFETAKASFTTAFTKSPSEADRAQILVLLGECEEKCVKLPHRAAEAATASTPSRISESQPASEASSLELHQKGNKELQEGKLKESLKSFTACIHKNPNDGPAYSNRSLAQSMLGNFEEAAADARECTRLYPESAKEHCRLGSALMSLGRYEPAKASFATALTKSPSEAERAQFLVWLGQCEEKCVKLPHRAVKAATASTPSRISEFHGCDGYQPASEACSLELRQKGNKELQEGKVKESLKSYTAYIHKNPTDYIAYSNRSLAQSMLGNFEEAAADARECTRLNPEFASGHGRLGSALMSLGRFETAKAPLATALTKSPSERERAQILIWLGECDVKCEAAVRAKEIASSETSILPPQDITKKHALKRHQSACVAADSPLATKKASVHEQHATQMKDIKPNPKQLLSTTADKASKQMSLGPTDIDSLSPDAATKTYRLEGDKFLAEGNKSSLKAADKFYSKALSYDPMDEVALCNRSLVRCKLGMFRESAVDAAKCVKANPRNSKAHFRLGVARLDLGQAEEAARTFTTALDLLPPKSADRADVEAFIQRCKGKKGSRQGLEDNASVISLVPGRKGGLNSICVEGEYPEMPVNEQEVAKAPAAVLTTAAATNNDVSVPMSENEYLSKPAADAPAIPNEHISTVSSPGNNMTLTVSGTAANTDKNVDIVACTSAQSTPSKAASNIVKKTARPRPGPLGPPAVDSFETRPVQSTPSKANSVKFDAKSLNYIAAVGGAKNLPTVAPLVNVVKNNQPPTPTQRRSLSSAPLSGQQPTSRSGSAAAPRFTAPPAREQKSLIVADTCGLMEMDQSQLQAFADYLNVICEPVAIPFAVLEELDRIRKDSSKPDRQFLARQASDWIHTMQVAKYVRLQNIGETAAGLRSLASTNIPDNSILAYAMYLKEYEEKKPPADRRIVKLLTNDRILSIKAQGFGLGVLGLDSFL